MVRTRAAWITRIQPLVRRDGCRLRPGAPETFITRVEELALPPALTTVIAPLVELLGPINKQIEALDAELERIVAADEVTRHLTTVPGVGPVTATAFVATRMTNLAQRARHTRVRRPPKRGGERGR